MPLIKTQKENGQYKSSEPMESDFQSPKDLEKAKAEEINYQPSQQEKDMRAQIIKHFTLGYQTMYTPRVEFNDLCVIDRMQVDQMSWNTYQPNNGQPAQGDEINAWRSRAMKPIVRNKCISIAAHATARLIFPKVFAYDELSESQSDAAQVMRDLMEWAGDQANYSNTSLHAIITALTDPASVVYTEYGEVYRKVKRPTGKKGKYKTEEIMDTTLSGFKDEVVPVDELFIENFFEPDLQKQAWLIRRKVFSYDLASAKYKDVYENFKYVKPGMQVVYNDANQSFYQVYDPMMRPYDVEEVTYWNRNMDVKICMVNGVMLSDYDAPNPRNDKLYPFCKFGYELINNRCFYYKSLAFKLMQDANIINSLYPMIIDGTYLNVFPAMLQLGGEVIGSDVIIPGAVTNLSDPNADLKVIQSSTAQGLQVGMNTLLKVDESIEQSAETPITPSSQPPGGTTAYEISRLEQNAATILGLFIKMISQYVKGYGQLRMGDILQYLTIVDAGKITDRADLIYKTFLLHDKQSNGKINTRKIQFTAGLPEEDMTAEQDLQQSYDVLKEQGGVDSNIELYKVNPQKFRDLTYMLTIDADVMNPRSEELERAFDLETYDRLLANPMSDQEEALRLLLQTNPKTRKDPDKFLMKTNATDPMAMAMAQGSPQGMPQAGNSPLSAMTGKSPLPPTMPMGGQQNVQ
jgi:hypothetical protein